MPGIVRGAVAGMAGTIFMSIPIVLARRLGLFQSPPPRQISEEVGERTPLLPEPASPAFGLAWPMAHLAYGAAAGAIFSCTPLARAATGPWSGPAYGLAVWLVGYTGYLPALGLYPDPSRDRPERTGTMLLAHLIYGLTLARLARPSRQANVLSSNGSTA